MTAERAAERVGLFSSCLPGWDAPRVIAVARALGFPAIEWGAGPGEAIETGHDGSRIRQLCEDAGVAVGGLAVQDPGVSAGTPERAAPYLRLAGCLGAGYIRVFAPPYRGGRLASALTTSRAGVDALVEAAARHRLAVLLETSPGTLAPAPELAASLVEQHPPERAGVLYDPGNTVIEGYLSPALAVARLGRHLRHVHVKNIAWARRPGGWQWRYGTLSGGLLDWRAILASLAEAEYAGGFSIDHLSGKPTRPALRAQTEELRALIAQAARPRALGNHRVPKGASRSPVNV